MKSLAELSREATEVLFERLGVPDTLRFLGQFDQGHGDYTKDRHALLGNPKVDELGDEIQQYRRRRNAG